MHGGLERLFKIMVRRYIVLLEQIHLAAVSRYNIFQLEEHRSEPRLPLHTKMKRLRSAADVVFAAVMVLLLAGQSSVSVMGWSRVHLKLSRTIIFTYCRVTSLSGDAATGRGGRHEESVVLRVFRKISDYGW